jgi:hypothetical protein|tara:strand:- start:22 stop:468 length:447 start_codon:yes stop_codon:yes gene_type:complete
MGTKEDRLRKLAAGLNYRLVKNKPKSEDLKWEIFLLVGTCIRGLKKMTPRAAIMRAALHPNLNKILDKHFKGPKRVAFDDDAQKEYNIAKTFIIDIKTKGQFKRYKLVEREYSKQFNSQIFKTLFDPDYWPPKDKDGRSKIYGNKKRK